MTEEEAKELPLEGHEVPVEDRQWIVAGKKGSMKPRDLQRRFLANDANHATFGYREYTPCMVCKSCVIYRGWTRGVITTRGFFCRLCCQPVSQYGTCTRAKPDPKVARRIIVDMTGAPKGEPKTREEVDAAVRNERFVAIEAAKAVWREHLESGYGSSAAKRSGRASGEPLPEGVRRERDLPKGEEDAGRVGGENLMREKVLSAGSKEARDE